MAPNVGLEMVTVTITARNVKPEIVRDIVINVKNSAWITYRMKVKAKFMLHSPVEELRDNMEIYREVNRTHLRRELDTKYCKGVNVGKEVRQILRLIMILRPNIDGNSTSLGPTQGQVEVLCRAVKAHAT